MAWGRLDDQANGSAKLLALSDAAWRMWGCGLIYCQNHLTDGFIPDFAIHTFGVREKNKDRIATELCAVLVEGKGPLWHREQGGYRVHDYLHWNQSRDQVHNARVTGKQRLALFHNPKLRAEVRARDGDRCRYCGRIVRWNDRKGDEGGTYDHVMPLCGNAVANLVVCCRGCNSRKKGRTPEEAGMRLIDAPTAKAPIASRFDLDISRSELEIELDRSSSDLDTRAGNQALESGFEACESGFYQASTYQDRTCTNQYEASVLSTSKEKQEHAPSASMCPVENVEISESGQDTRVLLHRRNRSNETSDGQPAVRVIAALARHVLLKHRTETDDGELREILKTACAKANLRYDGTTVADGIDRARAHLKRKRLLL